MDILTELRMPEEVMTEPYKSMGDLCRQAADEIERLRAFARWAIEEGSFAGCDLDGGSIQDKAVELGILVRTKYDPAVHGESDSAERGDDWFVFAPALEQKAGKS